MKTKRFWLILLAVLSALCLVFAVVGCDDGEENKVPSGNTGNDEEDNTRRCDHEFGEWEIVTPAVKCSDEPGLKRRRCIKPNCTTKGGFVQEEEIPALGHNKRFYEAQDPTCIEGGWYEYWACRDCSATNFEEMKRDALGHDLREIPAQDATCYQEGWNAYKKCARCTYTEGDPNIQPKLDHNYQQNADGSKTCTMCGMPELNETTNLKYSLSADMKSFIVTGFATNDEGLILDESNQPYKYQPDEIAAKHTEYTPWSKLDLNDEGELCENTGSGLSKVEYNKIQTLVIPDEHTEDGKTLPVTGIGRSAFRDCRFITFVATGNSVVSIDMEAFYYCFNLKDVILGQNVESLTGASFAYTGIKSLEFPRKVGDIGTTAFAHCDDLVELKVVDDNPRLFSITNCVLRRADNVLILGCGGSVIPEKAEEIGSWAFAMCSGIKTVDLKNVKRVDASAFMLCSHLEEVKLSENLERIDNQAFYSCTSLAKLDMYSKLEWIGNSVFADCYNLKEIRYHGTAEQFLRVGFYRGEHWDWNDGLYDSQGNPTDNKEVNWTGREYIIYLNNGKALKASPKGDGMGNKYEEYTIPEESGEE